MAASYAAVASVREEMGVAMEQMSSMVSDVSVESRVEETQAVSEALSFVWLESLIEPYVQVDDEPVTTRLDRYAFAGAVLFGVVGVICAHLFRNQLGLLLLQIGLALELLCLAAVLIGTYRQAVRFYRQQHKDFAQVLDERLVQYNVIVDAIRRHPLSVIGTHLRYVRDRKNRLVYRAGLISGGFEKFGIVPFLAAIYLQLKDWSFGDWKGLADHVHVLGSILLWALMILYAVSFWAVRAKSRLDLYEVVLTEASVRESD
jgi:hypothetical protein